MGALFDLSFTKFVAPLIAKIIYILVMVAIVVAYLTFVVVAFDASVGFGFLVLLIIGPLFALLYLAFVRVSLESLLSAIFTAQNTAELVRLQGGTPPNASGASPAPYTPSAPPSYGGPGYGTPGQPPAGQSYTPPPADPPTAPPPSAPPAP